ncbi:MAG: IS110 family transposase, partial [Syntrophobacteraceae bacterium]
IQVVYEAGCFGFWLHDRLIEHGVDCMITPPSLIPQESGNRVKTDRRDSRKLAHLLAKGLLKRVFVPGKKECYHRQVVRRRRQLIGDRTRVQNRIKAELRFYGINISEPIGKWTKGFMENLNKIRFEDKFMQESFNRLLEQYRFLTEQIEKQNSLIHELSEKELYRDRAEILKSVPGIGTIAAMELLLELQDVSRFRQADQLAAYVGLTPSQYSSADKIRMGRITKVGKHSVRAILVQVAWQLIRKDQAMREKYERIKIRSGAKRAIVAIARTLFLRVRRIWLDAVPYRLALSA